jgi:hypothetical protein
MAPFNAGCDGRRRFWPAPNRIEDAPVGWVTVANMHARLIVNGPRDLRIFCAQAGFDRQVSGQTCIAWVAVDNVDVAARDRVNGKAMKMVPNGVAYETGANPAIVDAEFFHGCKQHYNVPLSFKELGDVVESLHAGQANQSPTHSVVRNGSKAASSAGSRDLQSVSAVPQLTAMLVISCGMALACHLCYSAFLRSQGHVWLATPSP